MKISIVITTYNRAALLRRAISSALAQTFPCEIIVVDDCSTDETPDYLSSLDDRVKTWRNSDRLGHARSVNQGIALATGEWIKLLDDDDYLVPDCVEVMYRESYRHSDSVICSCQAIQVDERGVELRRTRVFGKADTLSIPQADIHYRMLLEYLPFGTPTQVMFTREAFVRSGGWNSEFELDYDDIESWVKIACFGDAVLINRCLAYRTLWKGGHNQKFSIQERLQANITIKEKIYGLVNDKYRDSLPPFKVIEDYLKLYWALVGFKRLHLGICRLSFSALLSVRAWLLLFKVFVSRLEAGNWNIYEQ